MGCVFLECLAVIASCQVAHLEGLDSQLFLLAYVFRRVADVVHVVADGCVFACVVLLAFVQREGMQQSDVVSQLVGHGGDDVVGVVRILVLPLVYELIVYEASPGHLHVCVAVGLVSCLQAVERMCRWHDGQVRHSHSVAAVVAFFEGEDIYVDVSLHVLCKLRILLVVSMGVAEEVVW